MKEIIKNQLKRVVNGGYSIQWFSKQIEPYMEKLTNEDNLHISTNIPQVNNLALESRAKELYFNDILSDSKYSIHMPLVIINPYRIAPLTAIVLFNTKSKCSIRYTICGMNGGKDLVHKIWEPTKKHRIPIVGLYPDAKNKVIIDCISIDGDKTQKTLYIKTFPEKKALHESIYIEKNDADPTEEYIYVSGGFSQFSYIFDSKTNIRSYFNKKIKLYGTHMLSNGRLLFPEEAISNPTFSNPHSNVFHELDFMGRVHKTYMIENGVHHFATEKEEGGNILIATSTLIPPYSMENGVLEIDRKTGDVIKMLDLNTLFDDTYLTRHDWAHINSIQYLPDEDCIILSLRNLHSVVKIHWDKFEIEWILGDTKFWEPTTMMDKVLTPSNEDIFWFYQQHAAEVISSADGKKELMLYDNHIAGRRPVEHFVCTEESYLLVFEIDETNKTVKMLKKFPMAYSTIRSNGIFSKEKNRIWGMSAYLRPKIDHCSGMIEEFDYSTGEVLNKYKIKHDFFSAHPIQFNVDDMAKPLDLQTNYEAGQVIQPFVTDCDTFEQLDLKKNAQPADPDYFKTRIYSKLLLIKETDNEIRHVYAVGKEHVYDLNKDNTEQRAFNTFGDSRYYITFPLEACAQDTYTFYLQTKDAVYVLPDTIKIN